MLYIWNQPVLDVLSRTGDTTMFERFTDRARRVVVSAQEEARLLNHSYIGTEHLLLGLLYDDEGVGAKTLIKLRVDLEKVRALVDEIVGMGGSSPSGHIPFTPRAKKVLELALREALELGHNYIGTEHLLLAIVREGEGIAMQVLTKLGITVEQVRASVYIMLGVNDPRRVQAPTADSVIMLGNGLRFEVSDGLNSVFCRATELADGKPLELRHLRQALQEPEGT
jgi:ATP-dependent Clp protease ATP-binding subunit ClpA